MEASIAAAGESVVYGLKTKCGGTVAMPGHFFGFFFSKTGHLSSVACTQVSPQTLCRSNTSLSLPCQQSSIIVFTEHKRMSHSVRPGPSDRGQIPKDHIRTVSDLEPHWKVAWIGYKNVKFNVPCAVHIGRNKKIRYRLHMSKKIRFRSLNCCENVAIYSRFLNTNLATSLNHVFLSYFFTFVNLKSAVLEVEAMFQEGNGSEQ